MMEDLQEWSCATKLTAELWPIKVCLKYQMDALLNKFKLDRCFIDYVSIGMIFIKKFKSRDVIWIVMELHFMFLHYLR